MTLTLSRANKLNLCGYQVGTLLKDVILITANNRRKKTSNIIAGFNWKTALIHSSELTSFVINNHFIEYQCLLIASHMLSTSSCL